MPASRGATNSYLLMVISVSLIDWRLELYLFTSGLVCQWKMVMERQVCLAFCWEMGKKVSSELKYWLSSQEILYPLSEYLWHYTSHPCSSRLFLGWSIWCWVVLCWGEEKAFQPAVRLPLPPSSWFQEMFSEKLKEEEWRIGEGASTILITLVQPACCHTKSLGFCTAMLHADLGENWA